MAQYKNNSGQGNDRLYWLIAIGLIITGGFAPIGILMIVIKLLNGDGKKRSQNRPVSAAVQQQNLGARTSGSIGGTAQAAPAPKASAPRKRTTPILNHLVSKGKKLTLWGGILAALAGFSFLSQATSYLWVLPDLSWYLEEVIPPLCFTAAGGGMLWAGLRK